MEIINLLRVNILLRVIKFPRLTILLLICKRNPFRIFDQFRGLFKKTNGKIEDFALRKKERKNTLSSSMGTKKCDQKERESYSKFLVSKYLNVNSNKLHQLVLRCAVVSVIWLNQLFRPYSGHIYEVPLKFIALVCLMSLAPKNFVV